MAMQRVASSQLALTVQTVLSEIGTDISKWPTVKHFTSWLGLSPRNDISGGKVLKRGTKKTHNPASQALRMAASSLSRSDSALGAFYRRMRAKSGPQKAITATAHKLARIFYFMLKRREEYVDPGESYYQEKYRQRVVRNLNRKAKALGFQLVPVESAA
jgi:transposase